MRERETEQPTEEEIVFEALYGYPLRLAQQVIEMNVFNDETNQEIKDFHQERIDFVREVLERRDEARKSPTFPIFDARNLEDKHYSDKGGHKARSDFHKAHRKQGIPTK